MTAKHGPGRKRTRHEEHEEHVNHERWLVSYSDMITVLMALFIVMYAISQVDASKFEQLSRSLSEGFNSPSILDGSAGTQDGSQTQNGQPDPPSTATPGAVSPEMLVAAQTERQHLERIRSELAEALGAAGMSDMVSFQINDRGLVIGLIANDVFFDPARADLKPAAAGVIDAASPVLAGLREEISIEGHANVLPVSGRYATNWELSSDRATQVLRRFVEVGGVAPERIQAVGFGESRPLDKSGTEQALATNRRVDIVVLSDAPENVRVLIPKLTAEG